MGALDWPTLMLRPTSEHGCSAWKKKKNEKEKN